MTELLNPTMNAYAQKQISELFDLLEQDMEIGDYDHADVTLARLSKYFHLFDDEHADYYQYAQNVCDEMLNEGESSDYFDDGDNNLFDWDGDALASAGFGTDESY